MGNQDFKSITVIGAGTMGHGIAEVFLLTDSEKIILNDISVKALNVAKQKIHKHIGKWTKDDLVPNGLKKTTILEKLITEQDLNRATENSDLIIEVIPEDITLKRELLHKIGKTIPSGAIIASNTSTFTITELGEASGKPRNTIGMHFFVPPFFQDCIEVMKGEKTSDSIFEKVLKFAKNIPSNRGHMFVAPIPKDSPGFISNRLLVALNLFLNVIADQAVEKGIAFEKIDADVMHLMKMGPFELADYLGLDTNYKALKSFEKRVSSDFTPGIVLSDLVSKGYYGKKSGKGFYEWNENGKPIIDKSEKAGFINPEILFAIQLNEGCKLLEEGVVNNHKIIDKVMQRGVGVPGPFRPGKRNYKTWIHLLETFAEKNDLDYFYPCDLMRSGKFIEMR